MQKSLSFTVRRMLYRLHRNKPLLPPAAARWVTTATKASAMTTTTTTTTTPKAVTATLSPTSYNSSSSSSKTPASQPRMVWLFNSQRRKPWHHNMSCRTMSTMYEQESLFGRISDNSSLPPWQVANFLSDGHPPSEEDWWLHPDVLLSNAAAAALDKAKRDDGNDDEAATTTAAAVDDDLLVIANKNSNDIREILNNHRQNLVVECKSQVVWVLDENDDESMTTKETVTVSSPDIIMNHSNSNNSKSSSCSHHPNYDNMMCLINGNTLSQRLFRNYGNETWHKTRAAWRCLSSSSPVAAAAGAAADSVTSCWPSLSSSSCQAPAATNYTTGLEEREMSQLLKQFEQQATDMIGEYDLPRRLSLQDVVAVYSTLWKDTEQEDDDHVDMHDFSA